MQALTARRNSDHEHKIHGFPVRCAPVNTAAQQQRRDARCAQATLSPGYITRKSLTVTGVARYLPEYLHKSLVFLDKFQHKYPFDNFSSMTFDLNDLEKGLEMVANRKVIRAVVESGDESNA